VVENNIKRLFRMYTISDYDKEESFLREQHRAGYELVKFKMPGFYYFKKCEPEDMIYQLDYSAEVAKIDKENYLQVFRDSNWEYLFDVNGWSYFKKPANAEDKNLSIFTDSQSKLELIRKVFMGRMLPLIVIFCCCIVPQIIINMHTISIGNGQRIFAQCFMVFFTVMFVVYLILFIHCGIGLNRLKKKYEDGE